MEDIFPDKAAYERALGDVETKLGEVAACAGRLAEPGVLEECLRLYAQLNELLEKAYMYAKMTLDLDNGSASAQAMHDGALTLLFRVQENTAFLLPELTAMEPGGAARPYRRGGGAAGIPPDGGGGRPQPGACAFRQGGAAPGHGLPGAGIHGRRLFHAGQRGP